MKVLMIGLDSSAAAKEKSKHIGNLQERLIVYGKYLDYLYDIVYAPNDRESYEHKKLSKSVEVVPAFSRSILTFPFNAYKIASKICKKEEIDIITTQDPIFCGIVGLAIKYKYKKPLLVQVHGDSLDNKYWLRERKIRYLLNILGKFVLKRADGVRVVSERVKERIKKMGIEEKRIFKLPIYVDVEKFVNANGERIRKKFSQYDNIVLFVGRLAKEKNIPNLLKAAVIVIKKFPRTLFLIVGDGPEREKLEHLAKKLQIEKNVVFEGRVEHDKLPAYYKTCDVFVLPSDHEGWGLVIVEALAAGKPVVTTDVGLAGEVIEDGRYGFVVPKRNEKILANKIIMLIKDHSLRNKMGKDGKKFVLKTQDLQISGKKQKEIYQKVLEINRK